MTAAPFSACLVANRGEIAVRIIRACRELGIRSVAVYSEADAQARHVRLADAAVLIGAANPAASYLKVEALLRAALDTGCACVHPGYGFLSEREHFAQAVLDAGLVWVGPTPDTIRRMGVKTEARALMQSAGVPLVPGFQPDASGTASDADFLAAAETIGYPVMVKAAGGGGGKGIRVVRIRQDLPGALASARREAENAFGDGRVFLEKFIENARHIEVQILADTHGHTLHLFERECSAQRRHQKVIEESPSPLLNTATRYAICQAAVAAARAVDYVNAGTVEFIATEAGDFYFLEMNTRLQVEHPVTELVTGLDIVKLQFAVAAGAPLPITQNDVRQRGHAIECRLYAEDPRSSFLPAVGEVRTFLPPHLPGVRVETGLHTGAGLADAVTIHYDPMIAKIIAHDHTRAAAIARLKHALRETVLLGTTTNLDFLLALLDDPAFIAGEIHTRYIDEHIDRLLPEIPPPPPTVLIALALAETGRQPPAASDGTGVPDADAYSPWARGDGFRLGRRG